MAKKITELKTEDLHKQEMELRNKIQDFRLKGNTGNNTQEYKNLRKERARILTELQGRTTQE